MDFLRFVGIFAIFPIIIFTNPSSAPSHSDPAPPVLLLPNDYQQSMDILEGRIINGKECTIPYLCSVLIKVDNSTALCSASIICQNYLLTAGHCASFSPNSTVNLTAFCGLNKWYEKEGFGGVNHGIRVEEIIPFPFYSPYSFPYGDIALLRLSQSLPLPKLCTPHRSSNTEKEKKEVNSNDPSYNESLSGRTGNFNGAVELIPLASRFYCDHDRPHILDARGWGLVKEDPDVLPKVANCASGMKLIPNEQCSLAYGIYIPYGIFCTENNGPCGGICSGDSGGALVHLVGDHVVQFGVTSFGASSGCANGPGGFSEVGCYYEWIEYEIKQRPKIQCGYCTLDVKYEAYVY